MAGDGERDGKLRVRDLAGIGFDLLGACLGRFAPAGARVLQAIAFAVHREDIDVVCEPVDFSGSDS
jgi:hypothetical protein